MQIYVEKKQISFRLGLTALQRKKYAKRIFIKSFLHYFFPMRLFEIYKTIYMLLWSFNKHFPKFFLISYCVRQNKFLLKKGFPEFSYYWTFEYLLYLNQIALQSNPESPRHHFGKWWIQINSVLNSKKKSHWEFLYLFGMVKKAKREIRCQIPKKSNVSHSWELIFLTHTNSVPLDKL